MQVARLSLSLVQYCRGAWHKPAAIALNPPEFLSTTGRSQPKPPGGASSTTREGLPSVVTQSETNTRHVSFAPTTTLHASGLQKSVESGMQAHSKYFHSVPVQDQVTGVRTEKRGRTTEPALPAASVLRSVSPKPAPLHASNAMQRTPIPSSEPWFELSASGKERGRQMKPPDHIKLLTFV